VLRQGERSCGYPSSAAIASHLAATSGAECRWGSKVTSAAWDSERGVWSLSGATGAHKDSGESGQCQEFGDYDALVVADAAAMRAASAGSIIFKAEGVIYKKCWYRSHDIIQE
jgi:hypothetical protein